MSNAYQLTEAAKRHVDEIGAFIAEDSLDAALKIYDELEKAFAFLADNPGVGHAREDLTDQPQNSGASIRTWWCTTLRTAR